MGISLTPVFITGKSKIEEYCMRRERFYIRPSYWDRPRENPENFDHRASDEFVGSDYRNGIYVGIQQKKIESLTNEKHFNCDGC